MREPIYVTLKWQNVSITSTPAVTSFPSVIPQGVVAGAKQGFRVFLDKIYFTFFISGATPPDTTSGVDFVRLIFAWCKDDLAASIDLNNNLETGTLQPPNQPYRKYGTMQSIRKILYDKVMKVNQANAIVTGITSDLATRKLTGTIKLHRYMAFEGDATSSKTGLPLFWIVSNSTAIPHPTVTGHIIMKCYDA